MGKSLVHICSVLLLIALMIKGFPGILPPSTSTYIQMNREEIAPDTETEEERTSESKKAAEQEYLPVNFAENGHPPVLHFITFWEPHQNSIVQRIYYCSVPTPPPNVL